MAKYGNIKINIPDISMDLAALKDLLQKGEITQEEYSAHIRKVQRDRLMFIAKTNGSYTPGKKAMKQMQKIEEETMQEMKEKHEIWAQRNRRDQFIEQMAKSQEEQSQSPSE